MKVEIKIDPACIEPRAVIYTAGMTDEISIVAEKLSETSPQILTGIRDGKVEVIDSQNLVRAYACSGKVFLATDQGEYVCRLRLYELEKRLDPARFVRISNSEIINLAKVQNFDLSFTGTICVEFIDGTTTYVSRRYVAKIRHLLGM